MRIRELFPTRPPSPRRARLAPAWALALVAVAPACQGPASEPATPSRLAEVRVPEGFDFATTRPVRLVVQAPEGRHLEVRSSRGATLYRGPALAEVPLTLPVGETAISVSVRSAGRTSEHRVQIEAGEARL